MKQEKCAITVGGHGEGHLGSLYAIHESFLYFGHIICKPIANGGLASFLPSTAMNEQKVFLIRIIMHCITCVSHIFTLPLVNCVKTSDRLYLLSRPRPILSRSLTIASCPFQTAHHSAVRPFLSFESTSAFPVSSRSLTIASCPFRAAHHSAV